MARWELAAAARQHAQQLAAEALAGSAQSASMTLTDGAHNRPLMAGLEHGEQDLPLPPPLFTPRITLSAGPKASQKAKLSYQLFQTTRDMVLAKHPPG